MSGRSFVFLLLSISVGVNAQKSDTIDLSKYFENYQGGFCIYNIATGKLSQFNTPQCNTRFSPCSTFKIPNSLIGIETQVISDTSFIIPYDSIENPKDPLLLNRFPFQYWFQDLSLNKAFRYSCVYYYQDLARRVGEANMIKYLNLLNYGNNDISSGIDNFWLCGSMEISISEQVEFLKKMYTYHLNGISETTIDAVKSMMKYEATPSYTLYGKTGGGGCMMDKTIGWYVGFIETDSGNYVYAMNLIVDDYKVFENNFRIELTKKILKELKII